MELHSKLVAAIENFDCWDRPWEFYTLVSSSSSLNAVARAELERIWATATETGGWSTCKDLTHGCSLADNRLSISYPWLSAEARRQLVNGAAYQWR
jgi:hypothetical protein